MFRQVPNSFPEVICFKALEIVIDRLDSFFIASTFLSEQKSFEFGNTLELRKAQFDQFLLKDTAWIDKRIIPLE